MNFDTDAAHMGVEWRLPFLDLRLVEFVLGLPTHVRFRRGVTKRLLREAMVGILPEKVRQRTGSAHFTDLIDRGLREEERGRISDLLTDPRIVRDGLVDGERLAAGWRSYWDSPGSREFRPMIGALCVEAWLWHQERTRAGAERPPVETEAACA